MATGFCMNVGGAALALFMMGSTIAPVQAQPIAPIRAPSPAMMSDARASFEVLDETIRREIQHALIWTGDYAGTIDGAFGPRTFDAIVSHQRRERLPQKGILLQEDINGLIAIAESEREAVGFKLIDDPRTGVRIGIPLGLLERRTDPSHGGARWQTTDERVTLDTRIFAPGEAELAGLFERLTGPSSGRLITYKLLREKFLVVSGETTGGKFYIRYDFGEAGIRGFTLGYDKALAQQYDWLTLAIAGNFEAFPLKGTVATRFSAPEAPYGTGLLVARNTILTSAKLDTCRLLNAAGQPVTARANLGETLLLTAEFDTPPSRISSRTSVEEDTRVVVLAVAGASGSKTAISGQLRGNHLVAALQAGAAGAPVFSRDGHILGIVQELEATTLLIAGVAPPREYKVLPLGKLDGIVSETVDSKSVELSAGGIATTYGSAVVPLLCRD